MGYSQNWEWETPIANATLFAAWSQDVRRLCRFLAKPGRFLPPEGPGLVMSLGNGYAIMDTFPRPELSPALVIRGPYGTGKPIFTSTEVAFNGSERTNDDLEAFSITLQDMEVSNSGSCKTNKRPYDLLVVCALARLVHYFPIVCISGDGGKPAVERAVKICQLVFGYNVLPKLGKL